MAMNLKSIPWRYQVALFAVAAVAALGGYYYFHEAPARAELAVRQQQLDALRAEIARGRATAQKLQEFQSQVADLQARLDSLKAVLPEQKDVGDLLRRIQTLATQSNLTIRGFRPQPIATREIHAEWPIGLELEGSYHNLGLFLDRVSRFPRIINVGSLVIRPRDQRDAQGGTSSSSSSILVSCTATTFVLVDQARAAAAAPQNKKKGAATRTSTQASR